MMVVNGRRGGGLTLDDSIGWIMLAAHEDNVVSNIDD